MSRRQSDPAPFRTRHDQGDGMLREKSPIDRPLVYQFDIPERLQKTHDGIRSFQQRELLYNSD